MKKASPVRLTEKLIIDGMTSLIFILPEKDRKRDLKLLSENRFSHLPLLHIEYRYTPHRLTSIQQDFSLKEVLENLMLLFPRATN
jgi:hypothetical protein